MNNLGSTKTIARLTVILLGCIPGLIWGILGRFTGWYAENQAPSEIYWHDLISGVAGTILGVSIGYYTVHKIFQWTKNQSNSIKASIQTIAVTFFSGCIAFSLSMGTKELITQLAGWCNQCEEGMMLVLLIPLGLVWYTVLNLKLLGIAAIASGVISYLYEEFV